MPHIVYIVDDEPIILRTLERVFQGSELDLRTFSSAVEALTDLGKTKPQMVISDRKMPHMDGTDLIRRVKEQYPDCICILISGHPISQTDKNALTDGLIDAFFTKPLDMDPFLEKIREMLGIEL